MQPRPWIPVLTLLFSATFWGLVWYPLRALEAMGLSGIWQTLASYATALVIALPLFHRGEPWRRYGVDLFVLALASGWCNLAFVLAMLDGTVVRVLLLFYLSPVWAVLFGRWLLGERISGRFFMLLALAMTGTVLMLWDPALEHPWPSDRADWLALSSGATFALSNVMVRRLRSMSLVAKTLTAWAGVIAVSAGAICLTAPAFPEAPAGAWAGVVLLGVFGFFFATFAVQYGVTHLPVQRSSVVLLFELVVGALSASLLAGEALTTREWLGGLLILGAGYAVARGRGDFR